VALPAFIDVAAVRHAAINRSPASLSQSSKPAAVGLLLWAARWTDDWTPSTDV